MSRIVSAATVMARIRQRGEIRASFLADDVLLAWVNDALTELWDTINHTNNTFFSTVYNFNTSANTETYTLPTDFYQEKQLCRIIGNRSVPLGRFNMSEYGSGDYICGGDFRFCILAQLLYLTPVPQESVPLRLFYIQPAPVFEDEDAEIDGQNGWDEFLVLRVLMNNAVLEQSVRTLVSEQLDTCTRRIIDNASSRISSEPSRVRNVMREHRQRNRWDILD